MTTAVEDLAYKYLVKNWIKEDLQTLVTGKVSVLWNDHELRVKISTSEYCQFNWANSVAYSYLVEKGIPHTVYVQTIYNDYKAYIASLFFRHKMNW